VTPTIHAVRLFGKTNNRIDMNVSFDC